MGNKVINTTSVKLGIYETSTDSQLAGMLGDVKEFEDGKKFRLCQNGSGALTPGYLVQAKVATAFSTVLALGTASVGDYTVTVTVTEGNIAVNQLKDGYFCVDAGDGELGHARKIKANTAADENDDTTLTFYDALTEDISENSTGAYVHPIYKSVIVNAISAKVIGVTVCDVAASAYFWAQVAGPCAILIGTGDVTRGLTVAAETGGGVIAHNSGAAHIGVAMQTQTDGLIGWINLNLE